MNLYLNSKEQKVLKAIIREHLSYMRSRLEWRNTIRDYDYQVEYDMFIKINKKLK